ncbi:MAG: response regulator [archaeon]
MKTIMVIDDEPDTLILVEAVLSMNGFSAITFDSSKKALDTLKKGKKPNLILLDMRMPVISGPEFCQELKKAKLENLKIVFFTASSNLDKNLAKKSGALGYIFKPFSNDDLVKQINKYLE